MSCVTVLCSHELFYVMCVFQIYPLLQLVMLKIRCSFFIFPAASHNSEEHGAGQTQRCRCWDHREVRETRTDNLLWILHCSGGHYFHNDISDNRELEWGLWLGFTNRLWFGGWVRIRMRIMIGFHKPFVVWGWVRIRMRIMIGFTTVCGLGLGKD